MGTVWRGFDTVLDRPIAVKFIHADLLGDTDPHSQIRRRFRREARILARLEHPGLPTMYDFGTMDDGTAYLVMRHIPGNTLADLRAECAPLPAGWVAWLGFQLLTVLGVMHQNGLVHRDVKPANLILAQTGKLVLCDFGIAASIHSGQYSRITMIGERLGTPGYQAPEVTAGEPVTVAGDLWSAGTVLTELMEPATASESDMSRIVAALTEPEPTNRPKSALDVADELLSELSEEQFHTGLVPLPGFATGRIGGWTHSSSSAGMVGYLPVERGGFSLTPKQLAELRRSTEFLLAEDRPSQAIPPILRALLAFGGVEETVESLALRRDLARCYEAAGDLEYACREHQHVVDEGRQLLGIDHPLVSNSADTVVRLSC